MIIQGVDANSVSRPLLVDVSGRAIVSAVDLTTTGGKLRVDASGNLYVAPMRPHAVLLESGVSQIIKNGSTQNTYSVLYTVTTAKTLYITSLYMQNSNVSGAACGAYFRIRNASDVVQNEWSLGAADTQRIVMSVSFPVPFSVVAGWDLAIITDLANCYVGVTFTGYEL